MPHATVSGRPLIAADHSFLSTLAQARTAPRHHAERAGIMLQLATGRSVREAATRLGLHPQRVRRCARRAAAVGAIRALDDLPAPDAHAHAYAAGTTGGFVKELLRGSAAVAQIPGPKRF